MAAADEEMELEEAVDSIKERRIGKKRLEKIYGMGEEPDRQAFLDDLLKFLDERGTPIVKPPVLAKTLLDLYKYYKFVQSKGGFVQVQRTISWKDIAHHLGITAPKRHLLSQLKLQYIKYILPYEAQFDQGGVDPEALVQESHAASLTPKSRALNQWKAQKAAAGEAMEQGETVETPTESNDAIEREGELHIANGDDDGDQADAPQDEFGWLQCETCISEKGYSSTFKRKAALVFHNKKFHPGLITPTYRFTCRENDCGDKFTAKRKFLEHLSEAHNLPGFTIGREVFRYVDDFLQWKTQVEMESCSLLNKDGGAELRKNGDGVKRWLCFRSKKFSKAGALRSKFLRTECPAYMVADFPIEAVDDVGEPIAVSVEFCLAHYGHDPEEDLPELNRRLALRTKSANVEMAIPDHLAADPIGMDEDNMSDTVEPSVDVTGEIRTVQAKIALTIGKMSTHATSQTLRRLQAIDRYATSMLERTVGKKKAAEMVSENEVVTESAVEEVVQHVEQQQEEEPERIEVKLVEVTNAPTTEAPVRRSPRKIAKRGPRAGE